MYVITGITGKVGGAVAQHLLKAGQPVRAVIRDANKAAYWQALGCEVALAEMEDAAALTQAFRGATAVFILPPPAFDPAPGFPEARRVIDAVSQALQAAQPEKVLCLSTIGAQAIHSNLLTQRGLMEQELATLNLPITFLRPGWFMENAILDVVSARDQGVIYSYLQPLERSIPMVATDDVGRVAATLLQQTWVGQRVVELEGPSPVSPLDIANTFAKILGQPVVAKVVERADWEPLFIAQGAKNPEPRMRMIDGFNEGWIAFDSDQAERVIGTVTLDTVLRALL